MNLHLPARRSASMGWCRRRSSVSPSTHPTRRPIAPIPVKRVPAPTARRLDD
jgi:hypothetical protein